MAETPGLFTELCLAGVTCLPQPRALGAGALHSLSPTSVQGTLVSLWLGPALGRYEGSTYPLNRPL
jgi:hypothetical protein